MRKCPECDYPNPDNLDKCFNCGKLLVSAEPEDDFVIGYHDDSESCTGTKGRWVSDTSAGQSWDACSCNVGCGVISVFFGIALCAMGLWFIALPFLLAGGATVLVAPFRGLKAGTTHRLYGYCPYCGLEIWVAEWVAQRGWSDCVGCKRRLLIRGDHFVRPPDAND